MDTPADDPWSSIDREIEELAELTAPTDHAATLSGYIRTSFVHSDDEIAPNGNPIDGFALDGVWLEWQAAIGNAHYDIGITGIGAHGDAEIRTATASYDLSQYVRATLGLYKDPLLYSSNTSRAKLVFYDRTHEGSIWNRRDVGGMLSGSVGDLNWRVSAQNGGDGAGNENLLIGKVTYDLMSDGASRHQEGGFALDERSRLTVGIDCADERTIDQGGVLAAEIEGVSGRVYFAAEYLQYGDGFTLGAVNGGGAKDANGSAGERPFDATIACMLTKKYEVAARYEDYDDVFGTTRTSLGLNDYIKGHDCKWQLDWTYVDSAKNVQQLLLGLTIAF